MDPRNGSKKTVQDNSIDQVMMLRFRPIAPKPPESDPDSGGSQFGKKNLLFSGIRTKRKYVRVRRSQKNNDTNHRSKNRCSKKVSEEKKVVTLQLLPERRVEERLQGTGKQISDDGYSEKSQWPSSCPNPSFPTNIIKDDNGMNWRRPDWVHQIGSSMNLTDPADCIESCVIVETITAGSSTDAMGIGKTSMEGLMGPGFVSDPSGRVIWVNEAYEAMVSKQVMAMKRGGKWPEMVVRLAVKQGVVVPYWSRSFTSRVKIEHSWGHERWSETVPCDVWRMENGGFAWRLDLDAALSLTIDREAIHLRQADNELLPKISKTSV